MHIVPELCALRIVIGSTEIKRVFNIVSSRIHVTLCDASLWTGDSVMYFQFDLAIIDISEDLGLFTFLGDEVLEIFSFDRCSQT